MTIPPNPHPEQVEITQEDRVAFAKLEGHEPGDMGWAMIVDGLRCDNSVGVQAFARHRLASLANRPADDGDTVTILGHTLPLDSLSELRRLIDGGARIESVSFVLSPQPEGVKRP